MWAVYEGDGGARWMAWIDRASGKLAMAWASELNGWQDMTLLELQDDGGNGLTPLASGGVSLAAGGNPQVLLVACVDSEHQLPRVFQVPAPLAIPAPASGLGSFSNYLLESGCNSLTDVSITIAVTEDIVGSDGFGFQLNAYSGSKDYDGAQQYLVYMAPNSSQLTCMVDNWHSTSSELINDQPTLATLPAKKLPAGYKLTIALSNDNNGNITGATYTVNDDTGTELGTQTISLLSLNLDSETPVTEADLAPIVAFQLDIVGYLNGDGTTLSSGAGTITYSAANALTVVNDEPDCVDWAYQTEEHANTFYSVLPIGQAQLLAQSFGFASEEAVIRKPGAVQHRTCGR